VPALFAVNLEPGDRIILCSDGLSGMMSDRELFEIAREGSPSVAAWNLIDRAVENGGKDNVTAVVLDVQAIELWEETEKGVGCRVSGVGFGTKSEGSPSLSDPTPGTRHPTPSSQAPVAPEPRGVRSFVKGLLGK